MKKIAIALKETIFQVAVLHLFIIGFETIRSGNWTLVNIGSILDLQFLIPSLEYTLFVGIVLALLTGFVFVFNYFRAGKSLDSQ